MSYWNTGPLICMSLNTNSIYCVMPRSIKSSDTCKDVNEVDQSGPEFCSCSFVSETLLPKFYFELICYVIFRFRRMTDLTESTETA